MKIALNPNPGTLGITNSLAVQASGYSMFVVHIKRTLQACNQMIPAIPSSEGRLLMPRSTCVHYTEGKGWFTEPANCE